MKKRYLMIPVIIISIITLLIYSTSSSSKKFVKKDLSVIYPYFNNEKIDTYINFFLQDKINHKNVFIDYDLYNENKYLYLTFYSRQLEGDNTYNDTYSFKINKLNNSIVKDRHYKYIYDINSNTINSNNNKYIALTFDDGPNHNTNKIIDILNKYDVKATFFVLGSRIKDNKDTLKRLVSNDMEIGIHTFSHKLLNNLSSSEIKKEIDTTSNLIYENTFYKPKLFRPSYGTVNEKIKNISPYPIIIWSVDTLDWKYHNSKIICKRVINSVKDGDIILMHDIYSSTANSLEIIIPYLQSKGYNFVTVSELFYYNNVVPKKGKVYGKC